MLASLTHNLTGTARDQTTTYTRNPVQEIVSQSWTNDLYQWTGYANGTQSYTANGLNQYTTAAGATLTHDAKGNLTGDGVWTYAFDADNKLKSATKTGYAATLAYDAEGRLRRTTLAGAITDLAYDGVDLVAEYDGAGTLLRRYVHGPGVDEPLVWYEGSTTTAKSWLYADHLGSIIGTANSAGTSTAIHSYGPFGEPNVTTGVRFRYTGQQYLGGLNRTTTRHGSTLYSPELGRFLQTDPIGTADDLNLYAYVGNNRGNFSDPTGLAAEDLKLFAGKVGGSIDNWWDRSVAGFQSAALGDTCGMRPGV
ncbi:MAG: RHS repeat-associated core domain-containing protein [Rhodocyclaceae bacterium]|nr:MAG: RHS repeat-associated core domain-containing protein [Rhodocyclaceae bacterium]